jgi:hypothetical protein
MAADEIRHIGIVLFEGVEEEGSVCTSLAERDAAQEVIRGAAGRFLSPA